MHSPLCRRINDHSVVLFVNSEMDASAFCPFCFPHSLTLSSLVYEAFHTPPSFFQTDTHTQNKQQVRRVLTAICRLPAEPGDLMKENVDEFIVSLFSKLY